LGILIKRFVVNVNGQKPSLVLCCQLNGLVKGRLIVQTQVVSEPIKHPSGWQVGHHGWFSS
jgi:hypothetical protein